MYTTLELQMHAQPHPDFNTLQYFDISMESPKTTVFFKTYASTSEKSKQKALKNIST